MNNSTETFDVTNLPVTMSGFTLTLFDMTEFKIYTGLMKYAPPFIILLGTVGNILSLIVLQGKSYRSSPTGITLKALAIADIGTLYTGLCRWWINSVWNFDLRVLNKYACTIHATLTYVMLAISANMVALTTIERLVSVWFPLQVKGWIDKKTVKITCSMLILSIVAIYAPFLAIYSLDPNTNKCFWSKQIYRDVYYWISFSLQFLVPTLVIVLGNLGILIKLTMASRKRATEMTGNDKSLKGGDSVTKMLLLVGTCFLLLNTPAQIYFLGNSFQLWGAHTVRSWARRVLAQGVTIIVQYTNNAINFLLYCLSGKKFRSALLETFHCMKQDKAK